MTINLTEIDATNAEMIAEITDTFVFGGQTYACAAGEAGEGTKLDEAGIFNEDTLVLYTRTALFATRPVPQQTLTYNSKTWRIIRVGTSPEDLMLSLTCEEETG